VLFHETLEMCPNVRVFKMTGTGIRDTALFKEVLKDGKGKKKGKKGKKKK
jgi:ornithine cyclodeaminase/alanine dehydrogenase-like protein (mu-crystallin family)